MKANKNTPTKITRYRNLLWALSLMALYCSTAFGQGVTAGGTSGAGGTTNFQGSGQITVSSIAVTPQAQSQNVGQTIGFTATATLSNGATVDITTSAAWVSTNTAIASFSSLTNTENVLGVSAGTVSISASYGSVSGSATLTVVGVLPPKPTPVSLALTPQAPSINAGQAVQFKVTETYSDNSTQDVTASAQFTSGTPAIATIGPLTATREVDCTSSGGGTSVISAANDSLTAATSTLTCNAVLSTITVAPATPSIVAGTTQTFIATCNYSDNSSLACVSPTWSSSSTATATITSAGLATGLAAGTSTIKAQIGTVSGTTVLTVTAPGPPPPTQTSTSIAPVNKTINKTTTLQYAATAVFSDGSTQVCTATWASTSPSVATITAGGLATGVANGSTTIQGTCNAILGSTTLTVQTPAPTLSSIAVTPANPVQYNGSTVQFTATGTYSDASTQNLTSQVTWTSGTPAVATIGASTGLATCVANSGSSTITATLGVSGTTSLTCQTATTNTGGNAYCTTGGTWIGPTTDAGAALPTACMNTALSNTPSPGTVRGPDVLTSQVQADINAAACGDTILVTAGSTIGTITLPGKGCDSAHFITIKSTGVSNGLFPAEGTRATPCIAGVASMPGRPSYPCPTPTNLSFKIVAPASGAAILSSHADHYRIIGAELTRVTTPAASVGGLVDLSSSGTQTNNIIFDRDYCHGIEGAFPQTSASDTSTTRCIYLGQSNHVAMIDSYFANFYDNGVVSSNGNTDAQCIAGALGTIPNSGWGVYKFVNNHCEASGEGLLFGGGGGPALTPPGCTIMVNCNVDTPTDLEIRGNYFFKPLQWNGNTTVPGGTGWPVVKNGLEMKTGVRAFFEGNVVENCWFNAQGCSTFNVAPINQNAGSVGTCPTCVTNDFVYRYNYSYNVAAGIAVYAMMAAGCGNCQSQGMNRISIHDNLIADDQNLGNLTDNSAGDAIEILATDDTTGKGLNKMQNVTISHNTFVKATRSLIVFGGPTHNTQIVNLTMQNNLWPYGTYGWIAVGNGPSDCELAGNSGFSFYVALNNCTTGYTWSSDGLFNWSTANAGTLGRNWPTNGSGLGNFFYTTTAGPGFTNYGTGNSNFTPGNYQLLTSSPLHNAGSDGKDVGADIVTLQQKIAGVRQ